MKKAISVFVFIFIFLQLDAAVYYMDGTYFKSCIKEGFFTYSSKQVPSKGTNRYEGPRIRCKNFASLTITGSESMGGYGFLYEYNNSANFFLTGSGRLTVSTSKGSISHIEVEYNTTSDLRIDGVRGTTASNGKNYIMSMDGNWTSLEIKQSSSNTYCSIYSISVTIGDVYQDGIIYEFDYLKNVFNVRECDYTIKDVNIASNVSIDGNSYPVVGIKDNAFYQHSNLENINLPNSLINIGANAFKYCSSLTNIILPPNLESIDTDAFSNCNSLTKVQGGDLAQFCSIRFSNAQSNPLNNGANLYINNQLINIIAFDSNITAIGNYSFAGCSSIEGIDLNENINTIGVSAFTGCTNLSCVTSRVISPYAINANVFDNQTYKCTLLVPKESIAQYKNKAGWANFHKIAAIEGPNCDFVVNGIYYNIVDLSNLTCKVTVDNPYYNSYFQEEISIPETVEYNGRTFSVIGIDDNAFNGSYNLTNIDLPQTIQFIGKNAFDGCTSLKQIQLPNTISDMEADFSELPIQKVVLFGDGKTIPDWFKSNKSLSVIEFNCTNVTTVSDNAFENCQSLTKILLPNTIAKIGNSTFKGCIQLSSITMPVGLSEIPENAFYGCTNLKEFSFGKNLISIGKSAFSNCTSLEQLFISASINDISDNAFLGCSKISNIIIEDSEKPIKLGNNIEGTTITGLFSSCPLIDLHIGRNIDGATPFIKNKAIETLVIGYQVKIFPDLSLGDSPRLKTLKIGKSLTSIPSFNTCTKLEFLELGAHLSTIPSFSNCASLRTIRLHSAMPQSVDTDFANKVYTDCSLEVPKGTIETYRSAPIWKNFFNLSEFAPEALATKFEIVPSTVSLYTNETLQLNTDISPLNANEVFNWESSNKDVVIVDTYGKITAVKDGEAIITAKTVDGSSLSAQCKVIVKRVIHITELTPQADYIAITVGSSSTLGVSISPSDATYKNLIWTSSDNDIAIVTSDGTINAVNIGKCTIKIEAADGSDATAYILVDVLPVYVQSIEIQTDKSTILQGEICQLNSIIKPENASIKDIKWEVSDFGVANISESGVLTGLRPGKATIYAYTTDGSNLFATKDFEILPIVASTITAQLGQDGIIDLQWSAKDYVKNAKDYNIYVSEDGGDFVLWLHNTTKTSTKFKGVEGRNYRFTVTMRNNNLVSEIYDETKNASIYVTK